MTGSKSFFACPVDNDGFPTCMGDGGECGYDRVLGRPVCDRLPRPDAYELPLSPLPPAPSENWPMREAVAEVDIG